MSQDRSPAYMLFHHYFRVMIPAPFAETTVSRAMGNIHYSNRAEEAAAAEEMIHRQHTTIQIINLMQAGARVIISNPEDSVKMYDWINQHVQSLATAASSTLNPDRLPLADLKVLDDFAKSIHTIARNFAREEIRHSDFFNRVASMHKKRSLYAEAKQEYVYDARKQGITNEHQPVSDGILKRRSIIRRPFKNS